MQFCLTIWFHFYQKKEKGVLTIETETWMPELNQNAVTYRSFFLGRLNMRTGSRNEH